MPRAIEFDHASRRSLAIYGEVSETVVLWSLERCRLTVAIINLIGSIK